MSAPDRNDDAGAQPELFAPTAGAAESPRLRWLRAHNLVTYFSNFTGESPETGNDVRPWTCAHAERPQEVLFGKAGVGDSEDDACADYATKHGLRLWNEEPPA